jgi:alginate O-acetyltransferase complex protein AlgJ
MPNPRQLEKVRQGAQWMVIAVFFGLLWLPTLDSFFHLDKAPIPDENRLPAKFPAFNQRLGGIRDFIAGLESYYNDHFGFRKRLIRWNNHWKHTLFRESPLPTVVTGRDGWLYYSGDGMIEECLGLTQFQPNELHEWQSLLENRRDWLAQRGIRYLFVIVPNKESIYPEFLPAWMGKARSTTKLDQFFAYMQTNSTVEILDLRPSLLEAKKTCQLYKMTDTHWNYAGAFVAQQELIRTLARQLPGLKPLSLASFKKTSMQRNGGDLAHMLGQDRTILEPADPSLTPLPPLQPLDETTAPQLVASNKWNKDTYPVLTENPDQTGTAILFRDSFSEFWTPFLGYYFGKVIYLWEETWEPAFIEKEKPVVVIDEVVERFIYTRSPAKLKASDNLK